MEYMMRKLSERHFRIAGPLWFILLRMLIQVLHKMSMNFNGSSIWTNFRNEIDKTTPKYKCVAETHKNSIWGLIQKRHKSIDNTEMEMLFFWFFLSLAEPLVVKLAIYTAAIDQINEN